MRAQTAYVNGNPASVIDGASLTVTASIFDVYCTGVVANSNGETMVAGTFNGVYYVDVATNTVTDSVPGFYASFVAGNTPDEMFGASGTQFYRLDLTDNSRDSITLPSSFRLTRRPNSSEIWVSGDSMIHVVDVSSGMTLETSFAVSNNEYDNSETRFSPDGSLGIKLNWNSKTLVKIDADTKGILASLDMSFTPNLSGVEVSADGDHAFVTASGSQMMYKVQVSDLGIVDSVQFPHPVMGVYRNPENGDIWAIAHFDDMVYVVDPATMALEDSVAVGSSPHSVAFAVGVTGVDQVDDPASYSVYPNPAGDFIQVGSDRPLNGWRVVNTLGQVEMKGHTFNTHEIINLGGLTPGMYFIELDEAGMRKGFVRL